MQQPVRFRVVPQEQGLSLARLVARRMPEWSAADCVALIKAGGVHLGHLRVRLPSTRVAEGERVTVYPDALEARPIAAEEIRVIHREDDFVVVEKPAGVPVAATRQNATGTLSEALRRFLEREGMKRPYVGVVHRLDQGASGLVLFTIRPGANRSVHQQFVEHSIERFYRVLVHGHTVANMSCESPLVLRPGGRGVRIGVGDEPRAKPAHTEFRRLVAAEPCPDTSLLEVQLVTGRTHQVRAHAASLGHPVVGDRRYGDASAGQDSPLRLFAWRLCLQHPTRREPLEVTTSLPSWASAVEATAATNH